MGRSPADGRPTSATHDASEAPALADRVVLLNESGLVQQGPPAQVYAEPVSIWAARLTGPASVLAASVCLGDEVVQIDLDGLLVDVPGTSSPVRLADGTTPATVIVRPDWTHLGGPLSGQARAVWYRGPHTDYLVGSAGGDVVVRATGPPRLTVGDRVTWGLSHARILPGEDNRCLRRGRARAPGRAAAPLPTSPAAPAEGGRPTEPVRADTPP